MSQNVQIWGFNFCLLQYSHNTAQTRWAQAQISFASGRGHVSVYHICSHVILKRRIYLVAQLFNICYSIIFERTDPGDRWRRWFCVWSKSEDMEIITDVGMFLTHLIMISTSAWEHRFLVPIFTSPTMGNVEKQSPVWEDGETRILVQEARALQCAGCYWKKNEGVVGHKDNFSTNDDQVDISGQRKAEMPVLVRCLFWKAMATILYLFQVNFKRTLAHKTLLPMISNARVQVVSPTFSFKVLRRHDDARLRFRTLVSFASFSRLSQRRQ